jgi:signal peptidase I
MPRRATQNRAPKAEPTTATKPKQSFGRWAWDWIKSLAAGFALFLVIRAFILQTWVITSGSMQNTLLVGDLLVLNKVAYGAQIPGTTSRLPGYTDPKHRDVVVFRAHHEDLDVIKRIIGLPGDTLEMRAKNLYLNGVQQTEPYVQWSDPRSEADGTDPGMLWQKQHVLGDPAFRARYLPTRDNWGPLVVPAGHFFMMGDNRDDSLDSRFWGFLDASRVKGRAEVVYFSYDRDAQEAFAWIRDVRLDRILNRIK